MTTRILRGDCRAMLATLPAESIQCVMTSPPYYGLRDYKVAGQIGLESTPDEYVAEMVAVFREVRRVLRRDGVVWLNLGDSYNNFRSQMGPGQAVHGRDKLNGKPAVDSRRRGTEGLKEKDLLMIPARVALALQADGWWLRSDIIWHKPNPMPESIVDRPTSAHEHVFMLTKAASYFYDHEAIKEAAVGTNDHDLTGGKYAPAGQEPHSGIRKPPAQAALDGTRNARNVWTIATSPYKGAHFATMPAELAERCIKAGTSEGGCCPHCRTPLERVVERGEPDAEARARCGADASGGYQGQSTKGHDAAGVQNASDVKRRILVGMVQKRTAGWRRTCDCAPGAAVPCVVLDPFGGAGTTALAADRLGRDAVLIEINPEYTAMATARLAVDAGMFAVTVLA